jgi:hypothetical protein
MFHNLTLGYRVVDSRGDWVASCVDDLTLQADLVREAPPQPNWYRVLSDDQRLLRLVELQTDPEQPLEEVLDPIAKLFGTTPTAGPQGMLRVNDLSGASVAIAAPLPGQRERPCELITAPMDRGHKGSLDRLLGLARDLGFTAPIEGATHLHFDATRLQSAAAMANLVGLLWNFGDALKKAVGTNPHCLRLGAWPKALLETVSQADFRSLRWPAAQSRLRAAKLTKYCDFNLLNCLHGSSDRCTIEVRILPVCLESGPLLEVATLFEAILRRALQSTPVLPAAMESSLSLEALLSELPLSSRQRSRWCRDLLAAKRNLQA